MKRVFIVLTIVGVTGLLGTGFMAKNAPEAELKKIKRNCTGYVVIEANKGIDCHGDTIKLIKRHGFYEVASTETPVAMLP